MEEIYTFKFIDSEGLDFEEVVQRATTHCVNDGILQAYVGPIVPVMVKFKRLSTTNDGKIEYYFAVEGYFS